MIKRAAILAGLALSLVAPAASAGGFREPEVRAALVAAGLGASAAPVAPSTATDA